MEKLETTLALLKDEDKILLALKKRGFGEGKYNGVGGKLLPNETVEQAMIRETKEEIGVTPTTYEKVGVMDFIEVYKGKQENVVFHLYIVTKWDGILRESEEVSPKWFNVADIPYDNMFPDDRYWMPRILSGEKLNGFFEFDENWNLLSQRFEKFKDTKDDMVI